ncbi:MAG: flagellar basal body P-ring formation chaperone FlgA [Sulfurimonas sp.]|jgi:flagella basal body P-ring formation protein FlgA|nr:flagellar basal body P-ring formation chaperone FlgA [Sulfurimonas sp.]
MLKKILFFLWLTLGLLQAKTLIPELIYVEGDAIYLSHIQHNPAKDIHLYTIEPSRYSYRIKAEDLLADLKKHGLKDFETNSLYINFVKKSPIDTSRITKAIENFYKKHYKSIHIQEIQIHPRGFVEGLPGEYKVELHPRSYLTNNGVLHIETLDRKKIFFDFTLIATIDTLLSKKRIDRHDELSAFNTKMHRQLLDRYRAQPIESLSEHSLQAKRTIPENEVITTRDVEGLDLIVRGTKLNVTLQNGAMSIIFAAEALQNGKRNDIISIQNSNGKIFRARVVDKNRVEIQER